MTAQYEDNGRIRTFEVALTDGLPPIRIAITRRDCPNGAAKMLKLALVTYAPGDGLAVYKLDSA